MKIKSILILSTVVLSLLISIYYIRLFYLGYCFEKEQFFSDQELLEMQLNSMMKDGVIKLQPNDISAEAYLRNHPKCCRIYSPDNYLFSRAHINIYVQYEVSEDLINSETYGGNRYYEVYLPTTCCGEVFDDFGAPLDKLKRRLPIGAVSFTPMC